ncbi:MAG: SUMF1/EgtB/PvdO family nonheme iron enzyme, partial [Gammaproteobacteria bacterium]|nr:SUMF1/EgtB/PvdO family nonheme iron enzyme [Gammaproteobacteria bacterium]
TPPGATLSSDGVTLGQTPLVAEVEAGEQQLLLQLDGYKPVERTVTVVAGQPLELEAIAFEPADGIVMLTSNPAGASVSVDRQFQGRTPLSVAVTPDASHQVVLSRPGYRTATRSVELAPGEQTELSVRLAPILGSVRIVASPEDAEVLVDGTSRGSANQTLSLTTAPHRIEIHKKGYAPHIETITPREGIEQRVSVILKTIAEAQAAVLDPVITSDEGHTLVLVPTGALQMGSPRREQGRRSNEIRRDVELTREFYISENEVTNAQYREFMDTHNSGFVGGLSLEGDDQPVVRLGWQQAARYCNWLSEREGLPPAYVERDGRLVGRRPMTTGYRMPTEAEWVWVTRFAGGARATKYPWGDTLPPPQGSANLADNAARNLVVQRLDNYDDGFSVTAPVGSFPANALGLRDLDGNVAEWMHDIYEASTADPYLSLVDPVGPRRGNRHVIRGSSWKHGGIVELRGAYRDYGRGGREDVGFRLARYAR